MTRAILAGNVAGAFPARDDVDVLIERVDAPVARFSLLERMFVEKGSE